VHHRPAVEADAPPGPGCRKAYGGRGAGGRREEDGMSDRSESPPGNGEHCTTFHFSQGNPVGPGYWNVPSLLRRVADTIESTPDIRVQDIFFHNNYVDDDKELFMTVYYSIAGEEEKRVEDDLGIRPDVLPGG
jgi:hypothetical protein